MTTADSSSAVSDKPVLRWLILLGSAAAILILDQVAKGWVRQHLIGDQVRMSMPVIGDLISITYSENRGAAFSILPQAGDLFLVIALVMIVAIILFYHRIPPGYWFERVALGLLLGGVSSNALDRIRLGFVVDFFHIQIRPILSNVSNFADHAIVLGVGILFIGQLIGNRSSKSSSDTTQKVGIDESETHP